jgi:hypothetical protein
LFPVSKTWKLLLVFPSSQWRLCVCFDAPWIHAQTKPSQLVHTKKVEEDSIHSVSESLLG